MFIALLMWLFALTTDCETMLYVCRVTKGPWMQVLEDEREREEVIEGSVKKY